MASNGESEEVSATPTWAGIGESCARAIVGAIVVGSLEAAWMSHAAQGTPAGFGLAIAGLWFPPMLILVIATSRAFATLARDRLQGTAIAIGYACAAALLVFAIGSRGSFSAAIRVAPIELAAAVGATFAIAALRLGGAGRRSIAAAGVVGAVVVQLFASHWLDAHRAYAAVITEQSLLPRLVLRALFSRAI